MAIVPFAQQVTDRAINVAWGGSPWLIIQINTAGSIADGSTTGDAGFFSPNILATGPGGSFMIPTGDPGTKNGPQKGIRPLPEIPPAPSFTWNQAEGTVNSTVRQYARSLLSTPREADEGYAPAGGGTRHVRQQVLAINLANLGIELTDQQKPLDGTYRFQFELRPWTTAGSSTGPFEIIWDEFFGNYTTAEQAIEDMWRAPGDPPSFQWMHPVTGEVVTIHSSWTSRYSNSHAPPYNDFYNWYATIDQQSTVGENVGPMGGGDTWHPGTHPGYPINVSTSYFVDMEASLVKSSKIAVTNGELDFSKVFPAPPPPVVVWPAKGWKLAGDGLLWGKMPTRVTSFAIHGAAPAPVEGSDNGASRGWVLFPNQTAARTVTLEVNLKDGFVNPAPDGPGTDKRLLRWVTP